MVERVARNNAEGYQVVAANSGPSEALRIAAERAYRLSLPTFAPHDLLSFVELTHPSYVAGKVHELICARLMRFWDDVAAGRRPRLMLTMPPRHGKTAIASERFPVWAMAQRPGLNVLCASYGADLALDNSRAARAVARSAEAGSAFATLGALPRGSKMLDQDGAWAISNGSTYRARGRGGAIAGRAAHILILDDMLKDDKEAYSPAIREGLWNWYLSTARTRLFPGGGILLITTRWHEDDLCGRLLESARKGGEQWEVLNFAGIAEEDEGWRRKGEALFPAWFPLESELLPIKRLLGPRWWEAVYQGRPRAKEGNQFKRSLWRRYKGDPKAIVKSALSVWLSVDCANEENAEACYSVIHVFGIFQVGEAQKARVLAEYRGQWEITGLLAAYDRACREWPQAATKLVEYAANGVTLCQLRPSAGLIKVKPKGDESYPGGSKGDRAGFTLTALESGYLELPDDEYARSPDGTLWTDGIIEEHAAFPVGKDKDRVDTFSQFVIRQLVQSPVESLLDRLIAAHPRAR